MALGFKMIPAISSVVLAVLTAGLGWAAYALLGNLSGLDATCLLGAMLGFLGYLIRARLVGSSAIREALLAGFLASLPFVALSLAAVNIFDDWAQGFAPFVIGYAAVLGAWLGSLMRSKVEPNKPLHATASGNAARER